MLCFPLQAPAGEKAKGDLSALENIQNGILIHDNILPSYRDDIEVRFETIRLFFGFVTLCLKKCRVGCD